MTIVAPVIYQNNQQYLVLPKDYYVNAESVTVETFDDGLFLRIKPNVQTTDRADEVAKAFHAFAEIDNFFGDGRVDLPPQTRKF